MKIANPSHARAAAICVVAGSLAIGASVAAANDYVGTYMTPDGPMTMEYRDDGNVRVQMADGQYMLISGGSTYVVYQKDGDWLVMPMDEMAAMGAPDAPVDDAEYEMRSTGRSETIAGFRGEVYEVLRCDSWTGDCAPDGEVVVSDDPRVANLFAGMQAISRQMSAHGGDDVLDMPDGMENHGLLRAHGVELQSAESTSLPDRTFSLPPNHQVVDPLAGMDRGRGAPAAPPAGAAQRSDEEERRGGWLGDSARDVGRDAGDEAKGETRRGVRDTVRDGVRSLFD